MLGHKTNLNKFKSIKITSIFSSLIYNRMKLESNHRKTNEKKKLHGEWKHFTKNNGSISKSKRKFKNALRQATMKTQSYKIYRMEQKKFLRARKAHSYTALPQKTRKISNKQPKLPPKRLRKRRASKA